MALEIIIAPDPMLSSHAKEVTEFNEELKATMHEMLDLMYKASGVGLAGNQVGILKKIIVIDVSSDKDEPLFLINPKLIKKSDKVFINEEGCLSVPELFADVERFEEVEIEYQDFEGKKKILKADGLLSICIQHEMDHLNGVMFYDHVSKLRKSIMLKKLKKIKKSKDRVCY